MRTRIFTLIAFLSVLVPSLALAHPGHGTYDGLNLMHYLTSPLHVIAVLGIILVNVVAIRYAKGRAKRVRH